jgi:hypothetical protein
MTINSVQRDCRFCSIVSRVNGEDPIGSAYRYDHWFIAEIPQPWSDNIWTAHPIVAAIYELVKTLHHDHDIRVRALMIAPNRDGSHPNQTRVLYYRRPAHLFAQFDKQEFILPETEVVSLATALLQQPSELSKFESYRQDSRHIRELMVCTHGNVDVACARFGYPIYEALRNQYAATSNGQLRVWRCSHFGGHNFAPTLIDLPEGRYWGHLEPQILDCLVHRQGSVTELRPFYRGWAGLNRFEQIAEREIWMREGWDWLNYLKAGQILAIDQTHEEYDADWAEVRLDFAAADGHCSGAYEAKVEVCGQVMTQWDSGDDQPLHSVKQYRVSHLARVA